MRTRPSGEAFNRIFSVREDARAGSRLAEKRDTTGVAWLFHETAGAPGYHRACPAANVSKRN